MNDTDASYEALVDLIHREYPPQTQNLYKDPSHSSYDGHQLTTMAELISVLALATKQGKGGATK